MVVCLYNSRKDMGTDRQGHKRHKEGVSFGMFHIAKSRIMIHL